MPGESDQTKWVGTRKVYPAIGDLQAIEAVVQFYDRYDVPGAGNYYRDTGTVPDDSIWVIGYAISYNTSALSVMMHRVIENATEKARVNYIYDAGVYAALKTYGTLILDEGQFFRFTHNSIAAGRTLYSSLTGYQIPKY